MNVKVNVYPLKSGPKPVGDNGKVEHVAMGSVVLDDAYVIENVRILRSTEDGHYFAGMPSYKRGEKWQDVAHPITAEAQKELQAAVQEAAAAAMEAPAEA